MMINLRVIVLFSILLFFCATTPAQEDKNGDVLCPENLVLSEVVKTDFDKGTAISTLSINHVYKGEKSLLGKSIELFYSKTGRGSGLFIYPPLNTGERVLLLIRKNRNSKLEIKMPLFSPNVPPGLPSREGSPSSRFVALCKWAEVIEISSEMSTADRLQFVESLTLSDQSEIAYWAIKTLYLLNPEKSSNTFKLLSKKKKMSLLGQIAVDSVLLKVDRDNWKSAEDRLDLFDRMFFENITSFERSYLGAYFRVMIQQEDIDGKTLFQFIKRLHSRKDRKYFSFNTAISLLKFLPQKDKNSEELLDFLFQLIEGDQNEEVRIIAMQIIFTIDNLETYRATKLRKFAETQPPSTLTRLIDEYLLKIQK